MSERHALRKLLRESTPELVRRTVLGELAWSDHLFRADRTLEITGYGALVGETYRRMSPEQAWSGVALLSNWAPTPFTLDAFTYASVESFYHSMKYPEGSAERARIGAMAGPMAQHLSSHRRGAGFHFRGTAYEVGSPAHVALIAEAVVAKVEQHSSVLAVLLSTEQAELTFPDGVVHRNVLARGATLALMIERLKRHDRLP